MRIAPNASLVDGTVEAIVPEADGWGATIAFRVEASRASPDAQDFLQADPGSTVQLFTAEPEALAIGKNYTLAVSVLGGPGGERVVVQSAVLRDQP
jgi:hypothetical protein